MDINHRPFLVGMVGVIFLFGCDTEIDDIQEKEQKNADMKIVQECYAEECGGVIFETISSQNFKQKIDSSEYVVIDIRTPQEHQGERIDIEQQNIDIYANNFSDEIKKLEGDKKYLIYCHSGNRTKMGLNRMKAFGFNEVYDLGGGIEAWKQNGFKTVEGE